MLPPYKYPLLAPHPYHITILQLNNPSYSWNHIKPSDQKSPKLSMKRAVAIALVAVLATVQMVARRADAAVDCGQVESGLSPCIPYLTGSGNPADSCCQGMRHLASLITSKDDRRAACQCAKDAANRFQNIKDDALAQLPGKCGVQLNVPISRTINCSGIY